MGRQYRIHRLLILNTLSFFIIGLLLSFLLDKAVYTPLSLAPGSTHLSAIFDHSEQYRPRMLDFYNTHLQATK